MKNGLFVRGYQTIIATGSLVSHFLLLAIRLFWGYMFIEAGIGKLNNIEMTSNFFSSLNIPLPTLSAYLTGSIEFIGGILLIVGLLARPAALLLTFVMVIAYATAHFDVVETLSKDPNAFVNAAPFKFLLVSLIVFCFGPGAFSLDAIFKRWLVKDKGIRMT